MRSRTEYSTHRITLPFFSVPEILSGICDNNNEKDDDRGYRGKSIPPYFSQGLLFAFVVLLLFRFIMIDSPPLSLTLGNTYLNCC